MNKMNGEKRPAEARTPTAKRREDYGFMTQRRRLTKALFGGAVKRSEARRAPKAKTA